MFRTELNAALVLLCQFNQGATRYFFKQEARLDEELVEFDRYVAHLYAGLGHMDRHAGLHGYCTGLMAPPDRKSVEPMASHLAQWVVKAMDFSDGGWCIAEDTGFPKQGAHAVGVVRQYCGMLGKQHSCQVVVSVTMACHAVSLPVAWQLYLPREWAMTGHGAARPAFPKSQPLPRSRPSHWRRSSDCWIKAHPSTACLQTQATAFQERLSELGPVCAVGVTGQVTVWPSGHAPLPPLAYSARGSPAHAEPCPIVHAELAAGYRRSLAPNATKVRVLPARKRQASLVTQQDDGPVRPGVGAGPVQTRQPCDQRSLRAQPQFSSGSPSRL